MNSCNEFICEMIIQKSTSELASWRMRVGNVPRLACVFSVFSTIQGKTIAKAFRDEVVQFQLLQGYTIAIPWPSHSLPWPAHSPCWAACQCVLVVPAPGPTPSAPKQWKSDVHVKNCNFVEITTDEIRGPKKKRSNIKARVSWSVH